jgi:hypothetical protein
MKRTLPSKLALSLRITVAVVQWIPSLSSLTLVIAFGPSLVSWSWSLWALVASSAQRLEARRVADGAPFRGLCRVVDLECAVRQRIGAGVVVICGGLGWAIRDE